ncbi:M28 family metallopeptidase [Parablastomonas sp. CN1-191]|uniref:M28 family metallopeptidase n=1 Tax=Parablastomonas sp. CN1-191 TaxID=3400908 RepID=UPI003BF8B05F
MAWYRNRKSALLLPLVGLAAACASTVQRPRADDGIPVVAAPQISENTLRDAIRTLSSDAFEGRGPATPAEDKTVAYIIDRFKAAGLKPGNKGSWTQDVPTVTITAGNVAPLTVSGGGKTMSFKYGSEFVAGSYRVTPQTRINASDLVFVGYGINAPELGWNDYAGVDMKGKTAVILVNDPDYEMAGEDGPFRGRRMTYYGRWTYKFEEAARQGATGALIVHDTFPAAYGWNVVNSSWTGAQKYTQTANDAMDQTVANGWIQKPVAEAIFKAAGQDLAALSAAAKQKGFRAVPLGLKASMSFDNTIERGRSRNVIGIQPGSKRPDEYVLYTAHWDHLGRCAPDKTGDDICNGAVDNASGVAALIALAEANKRAGPAERSQVFAAVTLEESGLLGSEFYAANPVYPLNRTVGGVNMDGVGPGSPARDVTITGGDKSDLTDTLRIVEKQMGLVESPESHPERGGYYRSDHFSFAKRGVPMFDVGTGSDWIRGGKTAGEAAGEDYTRNRYHQPADEYQESWDMSGALQQVELYYRLGRMLAMSKAWPNWRAGDEFRAIRDKDCAASGGC